jgi:uncharacterized membrane protein
MNLTETQIKELYAFTVKKYVEHYDVQTELVDHLATSIEAKMEQKNVTFDVALQQVYAGFGIFGFSDLIEQKTREAGIKGRILFRKTFIEYFKLPKILLFVIILLVSYKVFEVATKEFILFILYGTVVFFNMFFLVKTIKLKRSISKPLLQFQNIYLLSSSFGSTLLFFNIYTNNFLLQKETIHPLILPLVFSGILLSYLAEIEVLDKLFNQQKRLYPEAFK